MVAREASIFGRLARPGKWDGGEVVRNFHYDQGVAHSGVGVQRNIWVPHRHTHYEIFSVRRGRGVLARGEERIPVGPRTLVVVGPNHLHAWAETHRLEGTILSFSDYFATTAAFPLPYDRLNELIQPRGWTTFHLSAAEQTLVDQVCEILRDPWSNSPDGDILGALLLILFRRISGRRTPGMAEAEKVEALLTRKFTAALLTDCPRLGSVKEFSQLLQVSRSYLHRTIQRDTGKTPTELIHVRLIAEAKRLLRHTQQRPSDVAGQLGFAESSYFSAFFRRHTGMSPKAFRAAWTGDAAGGAAPEPPTPNEA